MANLEANIEIVNERFRSAQHLGSCSRTDLLGKKVRRPLLLSMSSKENAKKSYGMKSNDTQKHWSCIVASAASRPDSLGFVKHEGSLEAFAKKIKTDEISISRNLKAWSRRKNPLVVFSTTTGKKSKLIIQVPLLTKWLLWVADSRALIYRGMTGFIDLDAIENLAVCLIARGISPPPEKALLPLDSERLIRIAEKKFP